jgi:hypothetical protein
LRVSCRRVLIGLLALVISENTAVVVIALATHQPRWVLGPLLAVAVLLARCVWVLTHAEAKAPAAGSTGPGSPC